MTQTLGERLRALRQKRGLTQPQVAQQAQVTTRTVQYWEADQQQPRDVELENLLKVLEVSATERGGIYTHLKEPRRVRLAQNMEVDHPILMDVLGPIPGIGDLIRIMRLRHRWTQEQLAEAMQVHRGTVIRWEATRTLPSEEDTARLCQFLNASPAERQALLAQRLSPSAWAPQLTLEECLEQVDLLMQVRGGNTTLLPLIDLHTLAIQRQLRFLLRQSQEALRQLAWLEMHRSWWLYMHGRTTEACASSWRTLNLARGSLVPEQFWVGALNLLAAHAAQGAHNSENAVRLLCPWLRLLPSSFHLFLLCDMALYAGQAHLHTQATSFLQQAKQHISAFGAANANVAWYGDWYYRTTTARVLLSGGKSIEAMNWLPSDEVVGDGRIVALTLRTEIALAAGEKNLASCYLGEAQEMLRRMPLPQRQRRLEELARQL